MFTDELISLFGDAQELIVTEFAKNINEVNDFFSFPEISGNELFSGLLNDLSKISKIVQNNKSKCILEIPSGKPGEFLKTSIAFPINRSKVKNSLKFLHSKEVANESNNEIIDTSSENKLDEIFKEIRRLEENNEKTNEINGVKLTIQDPPKFETKTYNEIYDLYKSAISKLDTLNEAIRYKKNTRKGKELEPKLFNIFEYINQVTKLTNSHFNSFNAFKPDQCKTIEDMFSFTRNTVFDIDERDLEKFGGNQSARLKTEITLPDGTKRKGFFTKNEKFDYDKLIDDFLENFSGQYREYDEKFFNVFFGMERKEQEEINDTNRKQFKNLYHNKTNEQIEELVHNEYVSERKFSRLGLAISNLETIASSIVNENGHYRINLTKFAEKKPLSKIFGTETTGLYLTNFIYDHVDDEDFCFALKDFAKKSKKVSVPIGINKDILNMKNGTDISIRNCAMTAVEEALGMRVLADSYKMSITKDNQIVEGVFMENAQGTDFTDLPSTDKRLQIKKSECKNPELLKSVADLQILDYICGNVDRHARNYFIKFDENNEHIIGVCGIDNDSSFSTKTPENHKNLLVLMPLDEIKVVTRKTADALEKMTPDLLKATLKPFNLDYPEINAAINRLEKVKEAIANGKDKNNNSPSKIMIVEDDQWEKIDIKSLSTKNNTFGKTFETIESVAKKGTYYSAKEEDLNEKAKILTNKSKDFGKDIAFYANELTLFKSSFWNSRKYKKIIKKLNQLAKKDFNIGYINFGLNPRSKELVVDEEVNSILTSIADIKKLAQDYLTHKKKDIDNNTLDETSKYKVEVVNKLIKTMNAKEKAFTEDYQEYCKQSQSIALKNQDEIDRELDGDDSINEKTYENEKTNLINNNAVLDENILNNDPTKNIVNINGINNIPNINDINKPGKNHINKFQDRQSIIIKEEANLKNNIIAKDPVIKEDFSKKEIKKSEPKYIQNSQEENVRSESTIAQLDLSVDMGDDSTKQDRGLPTLENYKENLEKALDQNIKNN